jgi:DNA-binding transcriptional LysR family regulator
LSADLIPDVAAGHLDVAFVTVPPDQPPGVEVHLLATYPVMFVCRPDHPLASRATIDLEMLRDETLVGGPPQTLLDAMFARVVRASGSNRRVRLHADDNDHATAFIEKGLGVSLMPKEFVRPPLVAVPLSDKSIVWNVGVATAPPAARTRAASVFLDLVLRQTT